MSLEISPSNLIDTLGVKKSRAYALIKQNREINSLEALLLSQKYGGHYLKPFSENRLFNPLVFYSFEGVHSLFWTNLIELLDIRNISIEDLCSSLNIDSARIKLRYARNISPILEEAVSIANFFGVSLPLFYTHEIDFESLKKNSFSLFGKKVYIPTKYSIDPGSKMRTFKHAVNFAKGEYGEEIVREALESMQISLEALEIPETPIHLVIFRDFHLKMRLLGANDSFYIKMGYSNIECKNNRAQFRQVENVDNLKNAYYVTFNGIAEKLDMNYSYTVEAHKNNIIKIYSRPNKRLFVSDNKVSIGSKEINLYRFGHIIGFPSYYNQVPAKIEDCFCEYNEENDSSIYTISY